MNWVAFFSQTGSEIVELSKSIRRKPDLLVTNNFEEKIKFHPGIRELGVTIMSAKHDMLMNYFRNQVVYNVPETLISLHGYLRILPADICERYEVYNGHPGAIDLFPELKGKDPQEKVWLDNEKYNIIGNTALYFHAYYVNPAWANTKEFVNKIGAHVFYSEAINR